MAGFVAIPLRLLDFLKIANTRNEHDGALMAIIYVHSRFLLLLFFDVVAQNDSHVGVSGEVIRIHGSQVIAHHLVVVWGAQIAARRVRRRCVERRHTIEEISVVDGTRLDCVILIDVGQDLSVLLAVSDGACRLNYVRAF